jgi:glycosyltransferase involved in cell wall biosynthesis
MSDGAALRIAVVAEGAVWGGIETHLSQLLPAAAAAEPSLAIACYLLAPGALAARLKAAGGVGVEVAPGGGRLAKARWLSMRLRAQRPGLLHAHGFDAEILCAALAATRLAPALLSVHSDPGRAPHQAPDRGLAASASLYVARRFGAARIIAVSGDIRRRLLALGVPASRVSLVYNGVAAPPGGETAAAAALRSGLGLAPETVAIGMIGRLEPVKGHLRALRLFARLHAELPRTALLLAGEGPLRGAIEAEVAALGIGGAVHRLGFRDDVGALMRALDIGIFCSSHEGVPYAALEMMRRGVPLCGFGVGGLLEIVEDGVSGLLAPPGDDAALRERLASLVRDGARRRTLGAAAARAVAASFSVEAMTSASVAVWREAASPV